jgi:hypothetical protein
MDMYQERCMSLASFSWPNMETLQFGRFPVQLYLPGFEEAGIQELLQALQSPVIATRLNTLRVDWVYVDAWALELILRRTPNLRVFDAAIAQSHFAATFSLDQLKFGLNHIKNRLTHFKCHLALRFPEDDPGSLGSLCDFQALTHLDVALYMRFGSGNDPDPGLSPLSTALPPNLETLIITDDRYSWDHDKDISGYRGAMTLFNPYLESDCKGATPKLKKFVYNLRNDGILRSPV